MPNYRLPADLLDIVPELPADRFSEATRFAFSKLAPTFLIAYDAETWHGARCSLLDSPPVWTVYGPIEPEAWSRARAGSTLDVMEARGLIPDDLKH